MLCLVLAGACQGRAANADGAAAGAAGGGGVGDPAGHAGSGGHAGSMGGSTVEDGGIVLDLGQSAQGCNWTVEVQGLDYLSGPNGCPPLPTGAVARCDTQLISQAACGDFVEIAFLQRAPPGQVQAAVTCYYSTATAGGALLGGSLVNNVNTEDPFAVLAGLTPRCATDVCAPASQLCASAD